MAGCLPRLDSANCDHKKRPGLLTALSSGHFAVSSAGSIGHTQSSYLKWVYDKNVRLEELSLFGNQSEILVAYAKKFGGPVTQIKINLARNWPYENIEAATVHFISALRFCTNIVHLQLVCCPVSRSMLDAISCCLSLRVLWIMSADILGDDDNASLEALTFPHQLQLTTMLVSSGTINANVFFQMTSPSALKALEIWRVKITPDFINRLALCANLEALSITDFNETFEDDTFMLLLSKCPTIYHLEVCSEYLSSACAPCIARTLTKLKTVSFARVSFGDDLLYELAEHRTDTLEGLYIADTTDVSGPALNAALDDCKLLRTLHLYNVDCVKFDPTLLCNISSLVAQLHCPAEDFIHTVIPHCGKVEYFGLAQQSMRPQELLVSFGNKSTLPALRTLDLYVQEPNFKLFQLWLGEKRPEVQSRLNHTLRWYKFYDVVCGIVTVGN